MGGGVVHSSKAVCVPKKHPISGIKNQQSGTFETALDAIISIDASGNVVEFNRAAENVFGAQSEDALGQELIKIIIPSHLRRKHRADIRRYLKAGNHSILGQRIEITALRANGEEFPVELTFTPHNVGGQQLFAGYLRDISEQKHLADELHQSRELFSRAFQSNPNLMALVDPATGQHFDVNEAFLDTLKLLRKNVIGKNVVRTGSLGQCSRTRTYLRETCGFGPGAGFHRATQSQ